MSSLFNGRFTPLILITGLLILSAGLAQSPSSSISLALAQADAAREKGQLADAEAAYRKLLLPNAARTDEQTMRVLAGLTATLMDSGAYAEAEVVARRTLDSQGQKPRVAYGAPLHSTILVRRK